MRMFDVNVLVHGFRPDAEQHEEFRTWLEQQVAGPEAFGVSELVLSGFIRVVTHPSVFDPPSGLADCLLATQQIRDHPNCVSLRPGGRHWGIFSDLCRVTGSVGNAVADAYRAALAIEHG
ncbi:MAG TPA: TA system VapC family ribonuclease toxin, partial [Streptosporangiaceae bacterium]